MHREVGFSRQSTSPLQVGIPARFRRSRKMTLASHASRISAIYSLRWGFPSAGVRPWRPSFGPNCHNSVSRASKPPLFVIQANLRDTYVNSAPGEKLHNVAREPRPQVRSSASPAFVNSSFRLQVVLTLLTIVERPRHESATHFPFCCPTVAAGTRSIRRTGENRKARSANTLAWTIANGSY
jgi:hypothetical protein